MFTNIFRKITTRITLSLIAIFSVSSIGYAIYAQVYNHAEPCPLCIAQRVIYAFIGIIAIIGIINNCKNKGNYVYGGLIAIIATAGAFIAHHHVWLQSLPPEEWPASCGMPLEIMFKQMPLTGFLKVVLTGTAECAAIDWKVFGISGPFVSMCGFILLAIGALYILARTKFTKPLRLVK